MINLQNPADKSIITYMVNVNGNIDFCGNYQQAVVRKEELEKEHGGEGQILPQRLMQDKHFSWNNAYNAETLQKQVHIADLWAYPLRNAVEFAKNPESCIIGMIKKTGMNVGQINIIGKKPFPAQGTFDLQLVRHRVFEIDWHIVEMIPAITDGAESSIVTIKIMVIEHFNSPHDTSGFTHYKPRPLGVYEKDEGILPTIDLTSPVSDPVDPASLAVERMQEIAKTELERDVKRSGLRIRDQQ